MPIKLTPTGVLTFEDCPRQYHYRYIRQAKRRVASTNLVFGQVVHEVLEEYLRGWLNGQTVDLVDEFTTRWLRQTADQELEYPSQWSPADLLASGQCLMQQFPQVWAQTGFIPALDATGEPLIERRLRTTVAPGITLSGKVDVVVLDRDLMVHVLDFKTPSQISPAGFPAHADQLAAYQLLIEAQAKSLGFSDDERPLAGLGFMELVKRKVPSTRRGQGPTIEKPVLSPALQPTALAEYGRKLAWIADDLQAGRFPKRPRMAHNTPCTGCDFRTHCWTGQDPDLVLPNPRQ
jgi:RecB family exonuclease